MAYDDNYGDFIEAEIIKFAAPYLAGCRKLDPRTQGIDFALCAELTADDPEREGGVTDVFGEELARFIFVNLIQYYDRVKLADKHQYLYRELLYPVVDLGEEEEASNEIAMHNFSWPSLAAPVIFWALRQTTIQLEMYPNYVAFHEKLDPWWQRMI